MASVLMKQKVPVNMFRNVQSTVTAIVHTIYMEKVYYPGMAS